MPALKTSFAAAANGKGWPTLPPRSTARRTSFCWCFKGKAGSNSPFSIFGPFKPYIGELMAPCPTTSRISSPLSPAFWPMARPSLSATMLMPIIMLTTNFIRAPHPTSPRKKVFLPMMSKQGWASFLSASSPAAKMTNFPSMAGPLEPLTGASTKSPPLLLTACPISFEVSSSTVDMSMNFLPSVIPAKTPFSPKTTARADSGSEVHAKTRSHVSITSRGVAATFAPFSFKGSQREAVRFHTVSG
mmetsp:Transcript_67496/g.170283  ORF Transcript_67496/g.170283 Transcript_67496/m.170283 type:complete len:245 (-) Transcript_67496:122-856(-)